MLCPFDDTLYQKAGPQKRSCDEMSQSSLHGSPVPVGVTSMNINPIAPAPHWNLYLNVLPQIPHMRDNTQINTQQKEVCVLSCCLFVLFVQHCMCMPYCAHVCSLD